MMGGPTQGVNEKSWRQHGQQQKLAEDFASEWLGPCVFSHCENLAFGVIQDGAPKIAKLVYNSNN